MCDSGDARFCTGAGYVVPHLATEPRRARVHHRLGEDVAVVLDGRYAISSAAFSVFAYAGDSRTCLSSYVTSHEGTSLVGGVLRA